MIYFLLAAAVAALVLGHGLDSAVIFVVVLINAIVGFVQEGKAENALNSIRAMIAPDAKVVRDGERRAVPVTELVPGDIVHPVTGLQQAARIFYHYPGHRRPTHGGKKGRREAPYAKTWNSQVLDGEMVFPKRCHKWYLAE